MTDSSKQIQPSNEIQAVQKTSIWTKLLGLKSLLVSLSLVGLLATNIATLVNSTFHDWLYRITLSALSVGGDQLARKAMINSPKAKMDELATKNKQLANQLQRNGKFAKETAGKVHKRLITGVARNLASLPSEALPIAGVAFIVGATTLDIYDACQTMKDFNSLLVRLGEGEENPDLCGQKVPSVEEVKESAKKLFKKKDTG